MIKNIIGKRRDERKGLGCCKKVLEMEVN